jgi:hypothetical protein
MIPKTTKKKSILCCPNKVFADDAFNLIKVLISYTKINLLIRIASPIFVR